MPQRSISWEVVFLHYMRCTEWNCLAVLSLVAPWGPHLCRFPAPVSLLEGESFSFFLSATMMARTGPPGGSEGGKAEHPWGTSIWQVWVRESLSWSTPRTLSKSWQSSVLEVGRCSDRFLDTHNLSMKVMVLQAKGCWSTSFHSTRIGSTATHWLWRVGTNGRLVLIYISWLSNPLLGPKSEANHFISF